MISIGVVFGVGEIFDQYVFFCFVDMVFYVVKVVGCVCIIVYDNCMVIEVQCCFEFESQINDGLCNNEFYVFFQVKVDFRMGVINGVEVLCCWIRLDGFFVLFGVFILILEEIGQIIEIG